MRQRVMIAMALACGPKLIIADEPTTALDVTIQAQILELMKDLTRRLGASLIIITHNLSMVARYADRVNVTYAGRIVESGSARDIYYHPRHPYTRALLRSVPPMDRVRQQRLDPVQGQPPDLIRLPPGCSFQPRCPFAVERHMVPNVMAPYLIILTASVGQAILIEASLSYLGLGVQEPTPAWGLMLSGGAEEYAESAPWVAIFPGLAITLAVFGFNMFGDSVRDALDPKLRSR